MWVYVCGGAQAYAWTCIYGGQRFTWGVISQEPSTLLCEAQFLPRVWCFLIRLRPLPSKRHTTVCLCLLVLGYRYVLPFWGYRSALPVWGYRSLCLSGLQVCMACLGLQVFTACRGLQFCLLYLSRVKVFTACLPFKLVLWIELKPSSYGESYLLTYWTQFSFTLICKITKEARVKLRAFYH